MELRVLKISIIIGLSISIPFSLLLLYAHQYMSRCSVVNLRELNNVSMLLFLSWIIIGSLILGYLFLWGVEHRLRLLRYIELQTNPRYKYSNPYERCRYCKSLNVVVDYKNKRIFCRDCGRVSRL